MRHNHLMDPIILKLVLHIYGPSFLYSRAEADSGMAGYLPKLKSGGFSGAPYYQVYFLVSPSLIFGDLLQPNKKKKSELPTMSLVVTRRTFHQAERHS